MTPTLLETRYQIHGLTVRVLTDDDVLAAAAEETLGGFAASGVTDAKAALEIRIHSVADAEEIPLNKSPAAALVGHVPPQAGLIACTLWRDESHWLLDFADTGLFALNLAAGRMEGWLVEPGRMPLDWAASFVLLAAIELLRSRGVYAVHGAALEREGRGVLIAGPSGSGKTTACLALARAGYRCLSDDHPLLRPSATGFELLPFAGRISVTDRTIGWFPELEAAQASFRRDSRKRSFQLHEAEGYQAGGACEPAMLVFPRIADCSRSVLEPLPKSRALEELLPQTLLVLDRAQAARQFETMARLVRDVPTWRLHFGEDVIELPGLIGSFLETA